MRLHFSAPILIFIVSHVISCSGGAGLEPAAQVSGLTLRVMPESLVDGGRAGSVTLIPQATPQGLKAAVRVSGAQELKALYIEVEYDPQRLEFSAAQATGELGGGRAGGLIELAREVAPGRVVYGQVLCNYDERPGFSGDGELAVLRFVPRSSGAPGPAAAAARAVSLAPATDASQTELRLDAGAADLLWAYYCQGDTDQNGEVNIADLTPIGLHFGEIGPFAADSIGAVVDADSNGEINAADITPIGLNYERRVSGYRIYGSDDPADYPSSNDAVSSLDWLGVATEAEGDRTAGRLQYVFSLDALDIDFSYWVRPFDGAPMQVDASEGTPSNMVSGADPGNEPPKAVLESNPALGPSPLPVLLYGGNSTDDSEIVLYEFDTDGDLEYETAQAEPTLLHIFDTPGEHIVSLRVTDDGGLTDVTGVLVFTEEIPGWDVVLQQAYVSEIEYSLSMIGGNPALAWQYGGPYYYARAMDAAGLSWPTGGEIPLGGLLAQSLVLAQVDGLPAVTFLAGDLEVHYLICADLDGTDWQTVRLPGSPNDCRSPNLLHAPGSVPLISYFLLGAEHSLHTVTGLNSAGAVWHVPVLADDGPLGFQRAAMALINGEPAMAYGNELDQLVYSRATVGVAGFQWVNEVVVDPAIAFTAQCSLNDIGGLPALAFGRDEGAIELYYVRADDAPGLMWNDFVAPAPGTDLLARPQLLSTALPQLFYLDGAAEGDEVALMSVQATDAVGADWAAAEELYRFDGIPWMEAVEKADGTAFVAFVAFFAHPVADDLQHSALYFFSQQ